jgi:hypothetical protein
MALLAERFSTQAAPFERCRKAAVTLCDAR